jgi:hypothetical protein
MKWWPGARWILQFRQPNLILIGTVGKWFLFPKISALPEIAGNHGFALFDRADGAVIEPELLTTLINATK